MGFKHIVRVIQEYDIHFFEKRVEAALNEGFTLCGINIDTSMRTENDCYTATMVLYPPKD